MGIYNIAVIVGSLSADSLNRKLANALVKLAPEKFKFHFLDIGGLPFYNQDDDANLPEAVVKFKKDVEASDGVMFVTPEYNRSFPAVLKNALDCASRPWGRNSWARKPAAVIGATIGTLGTSLAQSQLRGVLAFLDMYTMAQPEAYVNVRDGFFNEDGTIGEGGAKFLGDWMAAFSAWVVRFADRD